MHRHYRPRTANSYIYWCKQYIHFHRKRHPGDMGKVEIEDFLNYLVARHHLSASSQSRHFKTTTRGKYLQQNTELKADIYPYQNTFTVLSK